jgi:quercetin dioxygenase-like cupin family protein
MSKITAVEDQNWKTAQLGDFVVSECPLWETDEAYTYLLKLPKGFLFPHHAHRGSVQVFVLRGCIKVQFADDVRDIRANEFYVVEEGDAHVELVEEDDTMLYVTSAENRAGLYEPVNLPGELGVRTA